MIKNYHLAAISVLAVMVFSGGCSDESKPVATAPAPAATVSKTTASAPTTTSTTTTAVTATAAAPPAYVYNPLGRRDPFTPLIIKEEKKALIGAKPPLERHAIHEFKLSGIVWGGLGYHAMLEGPDGKGYFIKKETIIGPNRGVVRNITQNTVVVEEQFQDPSGETKKKEIVIELRKKQEGTP